MLSMVVQEEKKRKSGEALPKRSLQRKKILPCRRFCRNLLLTATRTPSSLGEARAFPKTPFVLNRIIFSVKEAFDRDPQIQPENARIPIRFFRAPLFVEKRGGTLSHNAGKRETGNCASRSPSFRQVKKTKNYS